MKIGFIGIGNMGSAIIRGLLSEKNKDSNFIKAENINIFDLDNEKVMKLKSEYNVNNKKNEKELVEDSDLIVLAVKPNVIFKVLDEIKKNLNLNKEKIILTMAAGINIGQIENIVGCDKKVIRIMPNTPAQVLEGMTAVSFNENILEKEKDEIRLFLNSFGKSIEISENLMHVYTAISGSLPAYVYMFIEAVADGGVLEGMPREKAYEIISQTVLGSAKMLLETKKHPGQLKDEVTSPGGTTIEAVKILENGNFRGNLINAVQECTRKSKKI